MKVTAQGIVLRIASGLNRPFGIAVDPIGSDVYFAEPQSGALKCLRPDGSVIALRANVGEVPVSVAVDPNALNTLYVATDKTTRGAYTYNGSVYKFVR